MASRKSTNIFLIALGVVSAAVLGYFMWLFLAPSAPLEPVAESVTTDIQSGVVEGQNFRSLQPYAALPIVPRNVGRPNPFDPISPPAGEAAGNANSGGNVNAIANLLKSVGGQ